MSGLRSLDIGGSNFLGLKTNKKHSQTLSGILSALVKLLNEGSGQQGGAVRMKKDIFYKNPFSNQIIEELSLSDTRLGSHLSVLLNALGLCRGLKRLNLSNCEVN